MFEVWLEEGYRFYKRLLFNGGSFVICEARAIFIWYALKILLYNKLNLINNLGQHV